MQITSYDQSKKAEIKLVLSRVFINAKSFNIPLLIVRLL